MNTQSIRRLAGRILFTLGVIALIVGAADPLEGAALILIGSGMVAFSTWLNRQAHRILVYRAWLFGMIAFGVSAMFVMSAMGGLGGKTGHSMWWALVLLPYPIGWLLEMANLIARGIEHVRHRQAV